MSLVKQYETGKDHLIKHLNKSVLTVTNKRFLKIAVCSSPSLAYLFCELISGKYRDLLKILRANSSDNIAELSSIKGGSLNMHLYCQCPSDVHIQADSHGLYFLLENFNLAVAGPSCRKILIL